MQSNFVFFIHRDHPVQYKIELRVRNHSTLTRMGIIEEIATCMPQNYVVDLDNPDVFVLVEVFKVCVAIPCCRVTNDLGVGFRAYVV